MQRRFDPALALAAAACALALAGARAWLCDDAFITFRVVEQLLAGHGPVYNVGERVQVFTHPLWFGMLAAWAWLGFTLHPGAMALGVLAFAAGLAAFVAAFRDRPLTVAAVLLALLLSRAPMDYATSGLETPASFGLAMAAVFGLRTGRRALALAALALMPLNRPDLAAWVLPFAMIVPAAGARGRIAVLAAVAAPALLWAAFSTLYYGSPVPNTALAKLGGGTLDRVAQGLSYVTASLVTDPGTLALIVVGAAVGVARRGEPLVRAAAAALALSLGYAVWAGGDFMLGRFLLPALWASLVVIAAALASLRHDVGDRRWAAGLLALLAVSHAVYGDTTLRTRIGLVPGPGYAGPYLDGAMDERRFYLPWLGLFPTRDPRDMDFMRQQATPTDPQLVWTLGLRGYYSPPAQAVVDWFALADPLLARIRPLPGGRPGHAFRPFPDEFWRWRDPSHSFGDARLDALARDLRLAHRSPELLSARRLAAIARLLRERRVPIEAIDVRRAGGRVEIAVRPGRIDPRIPRAGTPVLWVSRDCVPSAARLREGYLVPAGDDGVVRFSCPAEAFERTPLSISAGTFDPPDASSARFPSQGVLLVRDRWAWVRRVPQWTASGHE